MVEHIEQEIHTPFQSLVFRAKVSLLQAKRSVENLFGAKLKRFSGRRDLIESPTIAESKTELWTESSPQEKFLLVGKVHNLRLAIKQINGIEIPANEIFSFWAHVGQANRWRGFAEGRELREGCIIPSIGGGLCQLSNALYDSALKANFEIVERHAHSQVVAGSLAEQGRDATVFWNYVDLRFRSSTPFRIEAKLDSNHLIVKFKSASSPKKFVQIASLKSKIIQKEDHSPNSCATCGVESCFRSLKPEANLDFGRTAFLVDEFSPEFDEYIRKTKQEKDLLFLPLDGNRFKKSNYAWTTKSFAKAKQSLFVTLQRSYKSRKLSAQGAARQKSLLEMYRKLAESYAKSIPYDATHLVIQQNILPFLWLDGTLGGRTFDVLMTALPMKKLQERLDFAKSLHPESKTLGDFRAENSLVEAEIEALNHASKIVTPHAEIASLFEDKSEIVSWTIPKKREFSRAKNERFTIVFPASTVGRKGCYELRDAVKDLDVKIVTLGAIIEEANFWKGIDWKRGDENWLETADLVVLPAFVEHKPKRILQAIANEIPVIVSKACGLENAQNVTVIENGDVKNLRIEIENLMSPAKKSIAANFAFT